MTVLLPVCLYGVLLSPPLFTLILVGWLFGAHLLLALPLVAWSSATVWLATNAHVLHSRRRRRFLDALTMAPTTTANQIARIFRRRRLRAL